MSGDKFGVSLTELAEIQRDWQQMSERMAEMSAKLGQIKSTVAKAVATDLMAAPFAGIVGFAAVAGQVAGEVADINERAEKLQQTKEKLTKAIAEDVQKLQQVIKAYQEADRKAEEDQRKQDKDRQQPDKPKPSGNDDSRGNGKGNGHGNGHGGDQGGNDHGNDSGDKGDDPDAKPSHEGKIPVKDVEYSGRGSWKSGEAAVRDYISQTLDLMGITDPKAREQWTKGLLTMAGRESSYNSLPLANGWDSNATGPKQSDGYPANSSRGPWQCIPSTFAAYHQQGTSTNIYDPVASCAASMNYMMDRYNVSKDGHDLASKVQQANPGKSARGY
ncbi:MULTISPECIES: hypothetical protein [unclassified Kitasatospora]|uniref:hypothetical protein n=1 Tax=unclassified Kitasatospora TaxID=2633591 RepID=UPI00070F266A|nr:MULTISPECIES: hypothetical protein [unclassified Kitasatospora]KQV21700.1 hypothetical protein ASC99_18515 [Kitasatospora sp. Root107]KRB75508.1 hypothetical protein ASE03_16240 [Kitasatospora sp. Root187]